MHAKNGTQSLVHVLSASCTAELHLLPLYVFNCSFKTNHKSERAVYLFVREEKTTKKILETVTNESRNLIMYRSWD